MGICQVDSYCNLEIENIINNLWVEAKLYDDVNFDSCIWYSKKVDSLSRRCPAKFADYIIRSNIMWADQYESLEEWDKHLTVSEKALRDFGEFLTPDSLMKTKVLLQYERCRCNETKGDLDDALSCYKSVMESLPDDLPDAMNFRFTIPLSIGHVLYLKGDYKSAIEWNERAEKNLPEDSDFYPGYLFDFYGRYYFALGDLGSAEINFRRSIKEYSKSKNPVESDDVSVDAYTGLVGLYASQNKLDSCIALLNRALKLQLSRRWSFSNIYYQFSNVYITKGETGQALFYIEKAIEQTDSIKEGRFYLRGEYLSFKGEILARRGQWDEALACFQNALFHLSENFQSKQFSKNPQPYGSSNKMRLLKTLSKKADALNKRFSENDGNKDFLYWSMNAYQSAIALIKLIRTEYIDDEAKEFLSERWFRIFESAIESSSLLFQQTGKEAYLKKAFEFSEMSKALSLLENLKDIEAKEFAGVPSLYVEQEFLFKSRISRFEKSWDGASTERDRQFFRDSLLHEKRKFEIWLDDMKKNYPSYFQLKFDVNVISLNDLQKNIPRGEALVEYFYGEKNIYVFAITPLGIKFHSFPITVSFQEHLNKFIKAVSSRRGLTSLAKIKRYQQSGFRLYQDLIEPLQIEANKITIIPDGRLNNLPFSALPTDTVFCDNPKKLPYLLREQIIATNFSASVMFHQLEKSESIKKPAKPLLILAPESFPNDSDLEIDQIKLEELFNGEVKLVRNPGKAQSLELLKEGYGNIFFFTHASAKGKEPYMQLFQDSLFLRELYSNPIDANLLLLGACETGLGKNQKGEGVLSLARGFAYQNVPNTIMTLWKVRESPSLKISLDLLGMHLKEGLSPSEALHRAQLNFINDPNGNGMPFFWAGFVFVGAD